MRPKTVFGHNQSSFRITIDIAAGNALVFKTYAMLRESPFGVFNRDGRMEGEPDLRCLTHLAEQSSAAYRLADSGVLAVRILVKPIHLFDFNRHFAQRSAKNKNRSSGALPQSIGKMIRYQDKRKYLHKKSTNGDRSVRVGIMSLIFRKNR